MRTLLKVLALCTALGTAGCSEQSSTQYSNGYYLLLDTSGTYTQELEQAKQVIHYLLAMLEPGDAFAVARIDSASFSEKDIVAKMVLDSRPSHSIRQKKDFAAVVDNFIEGVQSSPYTDISGGMLQGVEYLNEARVGSKTILIYSDLQEDLPKDHVRDVAWILDGFTVKALNVTKLRQDNQNPQVYLDRVADWQSKVIQGGGDWHLINDLEKPDALL